MELRHEGQMDPNALLRILKVLDKGAVGLQKFILISAFVVITCAMLAGIIGRYVVGLPVWGMDELSGHMALWLYLIGGAYATRTGEHIKADIVRMIIKNSRALGVVRLLTMVVSAVVAGYMAAWSCEYLSWSIAEDETMIAWKWPTAYFQVSVLVGATLMAAYFAAEAISLIRDARTRGLAGIGEP